MSTMTGRTYDYEIEVESTEIIRRRVRIRGVPSLEVAQEQAAATVAQKDGGEYLFTVDFTTRVVSHEMTKTEDVCDECEGSGSVYETEDGTSVTTEPAPAGQGETCPQCDGLGRVEVQ